MERLTLRQQKALTALLSSRTHKEAAHKAGISDRRLREYLQDPTFKREYQTRLDEILSDATKAAKNAMQPAVDTLREICEDKSRSDTARIMAARTILDAGLRMNHAVEIADRIAQLERCANVQDD